MKRSSVFALTTIAALAITTAAHSQPVLGSLQNVGNIIAQSVQRKAPVELSLSVAKQVQQAEKTTWQESGDRITAQPGETLRYTLKSQNNGQKAVNNLLLTQPIPKGTTYLLKSNQQPNAAVTYSIDNGKSYTTTPMVQVKLANGQIATQPAPASAYTHLRWQLNGAIAPGQSTSVSYQVMVR